MDDNDLDILSDLELIADKTLATLDPFIRVQMQRKGITFILNTYTGFDTEYTLKDEKKHLNRLLSVQLAVKARVIIKVPLYNLYDISYVHPLTSDITTYFKPKYLEWVKSDDSNTPSQSGSGGKKVYEMNLINTSIKACVNSIRLIKYPTLYNLNSELVESLHGITGVIYFEDLKKDQIIFVLPISEVLTYVGYPSNEDGYSLKELVKKAYSMAFPTFTTDFELFTSLINNSLSYKGGVTKFVEWFKECNKPRARTVLTFNTTDKISFNLVKKLYIIAHYNTADLSMLKDFDEFKDDFSIVGKSFVTLGKPIPLEGNFVYIRDTHLLTPASSKGLEALGKLYDTGLEKKAISKDDLEHMDEYLEREPKLFEEYAIQDAIIPLTHAITLEGVNFTTKRVGIPITLSSLGRSLVLTK